MIPTDDVKPLTALREFLKLESAGGVVLVIAAIAAMIAANTALAPWYQALLDVPIRIQVGGFALDKSLLIWINDLLMAIFFLLVGLEIKREVVMGELSDGAKVALPAIAALGGMLAFENAATGEVIVTDRIGILAGTLISAFAGYVVLHYVLPKHAALHA